MEAGLEIRLVAHSDAARETNAESRRNKGFPGEAGLCRSKHGPRLNRGQDDQPAERIGRLLRVLWEVPIDLNQFLSADCARFDNLRAARFSCFVATVWGTAAIDDCVWMHTYRWGTVLCTM